MTTLARGPGVSRPLAEVVAEVQRFAAAGYREVVLSGVHLGSYGRDLGRPAGLRELVAALLADTCLLYTSLVGVGGLLAFTRTGSIIYSERWTTAWDK